MPSLTNKYRGDESRDSSVQRNQANKSFEEISADRYDSAGHIYAPDDKNVGLKRSHATPLPDATTRNFSNIETSVFVGSIRPECRQNRRDEKEEEKLVTDRP